MSTVQPGGPATEPTVAVAIVTYNSADVIDACIEALPAGLAGVTAAVLVADNGSADDTVERARAHSTDVQILPTGGNVGYAAAINIARAAAPEHDFLLVLNPDTVIAPGSVRALVNALRAAPGRGIAVPRFQTPGGELSMSLRRTPSLRTALSEAILGGPRAARRGWGEIVVDTARYATSGAVDWATGAAVLVSRACWDEVGPWDPVFLLYSEETDYMLRARDLGYLTWYAADAVVVHRGGGLGASPFLWSLMIANKVRLYGMRHGQPATLVYRSILLAGEAVRALAGKPRSRAAVRLLVRPSRVPVTLPG